MTPCRSGWVDTIVSCQGSTVMLLEMFFGTQSRHGILGIDGCVWGRGGAIGGVRYLSCGSHGWRFDSGLQRMWFCGRYLALWNLRQDLHLPGIRVQGGFL